MKIKAGRPPLPTDNPSTVLLKFQTQEQRMVFYRLGEGNVSKGVRLAADLIAGIFKGK